MRPQRYAVRFFSGHICTVYIEAESEDDAIVKSQEHVPLDRYGAVWMVATEEPA